MESKKYLIYDNLVRGAGIGHSLACYNYGLNMAQEKGLKFLPSLLQLGHGVGGGGALENFLGLPNYTAEREEALRDSPHLVQHENYHPTVNPTSEDYSKTKKYFLEAYKGVCREPSSLLHPTLINITISIRRGDIVLTNAGGHKDRLLPDSYYVSALDHVIENLGSTNFFITIYSDGDRQGNYINHTGESVDINDLFSKYKNQLRFVAVHTAARATEETFLQLHTCVSSDIYIGSISGFSQVIQLFRADKKSIFPAFYKLPIYGQAQSIEYFEGP